MAAAQPIATKTTGTFAHRLLAWWDVHGRKDLPWQHPRTPYRVWVSEIMLQQTQVSTVIPYFERFMASFPDVTTLAAASLDEVLAHWAGLGYYARGRNLHKAAIIILQEHGGEFPATPERLVALPGIGESTANAIISQAFDQPAVVLDGNVRRVMARHAAVAGPATKASVLQQLWREAETRQARHRAADYTQAIMDLGATVCTRANPYCVHCPVQDDCVALQTGSVYQYPGKKAKTRVRQKSLHMLIIRKPDNSILLERRPPAGIWGGLWCLPEGESAAELIDRFGIENVPDRKLPALEHRLTHIRMTIHAAICEPPANAGEVECNNHQCWFGADEWPLLGLPKPVQALLNDNLDGIIT